MRPVGYESNRFDKAVPYFSNQSNNDIIKNIKDIFTFLSKGNLDKRIMETVNNSDYQSLSYYILYMSKKYNNEYIQFKPQLLKNGINYLTLREMYEYLINQ